MNHSFAGHCLNIYQDFSEFPSDIDTFISRVLWQARVCRRSKTHNRNCYAKTGFPIVSKAKLLVRQKPAVVHTARTHSVAQFLTFLCVVATFSRTQGNASFIWLKSFLYKQCMFLIH